MAIERLKFRCYRCNQLLGATPNKAGSVVTCPKCSAELLIPVPDLAADSGFGDQAQDPAPMPAKVRAETRPRAVPELAPTQEPAFTATAVKPVPKPAQTNTYIDELAAVLPPDLIDLKPEDLRVEAEFFESLSRQPQALEVREPSPWPPVLPSAPSLGTEAYLSPSPPLIVLETASPASSPAPERSPVRETVELAPRPAELPPPIPGLIRTESVLVGTAIEIEHPTIVPPGSETRRLREVILPASVVLSWSLFVLLGIALSFVAGLLMGHFIWKTH